MTTMPKGAHGKCGCGARGGHPPAPGGSAAVSCTAGFKTETCSREKRLAQAPKGPMAPSEQQHPGLEMQPKLVEGVTFFPAILTVDNQEKQYLFVVHV